MNAPSIGARVAAALLLAGLLASSHAPARAALQARTYTYHSANNIYPSYSPDGKRIIWSSGRETYFHGFVLWSSSPDTDSAAAVTHGDWGDEYAHYSPDGKTILFMSNRNGGFSVYARRADLDSVWTVTDSSLTNLYPNWVHDSQRFVYVTVRGDSSTALMVRNLETGAERDLFEVRGSIFYPCVSPDDRYVYFSTAMGGVKYDIYRIPLAGGKPELWNDIPGNKMTPIFTPDGQHILFARERGDNAFQLWVAPVADGRAAKEITSGRPNAYYPAFSPDGRTLIFCSTDETRSQDIWMAPWTGEELEGR